MRLCAELLRLTAVCPETRGSDFLKDHFTIHQVCKCCEVSRATVLRMEKRGLLQPAYIDPRTGYRYYDTNNMMRILHIRMFISMGLSYNDVMLYFRSEGKAQELLHILQGRLSALRQAYDAIELRITDRQDRKAEIIRLPEYVCYQKEFPASASGGKSQNLYETFQEALKKGYRPLISEQVFLVNKREEPWSHKDEKTTSDCDYICCIPLRRDCEDEHTVVYPGCTAFSMLCYGDSSAIGKARIELGRRLRALGLEPAGYPRDIAIVSGCTGQGFRQKNYASRLMVPIAALPDSEIERLNHTLRLAAPFSQGNS